jgi:hypothetical protein
MNYIDTLKSVELVIATVKYPCLWEKAVSERPHWQNSLLQRMTGAWL